LAEIRKLLVSGKLQVHAVVDQPRGSRTP
jgi:hypothetical protein